MNLIEWTSYYDSGVMGETENAETGKRVFIEGGHWGQVLH